MGTGEQTYPEDIHIFLDGGCHNLLDSSVQSGVDNVHTCVAETASYDLCPAVVTVQPDLGNKNSNSMVHSVVLLMRSG
jgi:hypothetical protein